MADEDLTFPAPTAAALAAAAGMPKRTGACPGCSVTGPCQKIADDPDHPDGPVPVACGKCGVEFTIPAT